MIPLRLQMQNFLSYSGESPVLDLTGVRVACLCGDNGHGKSALLDAITWVLWGSARGRRYGQGGGSPDELVNQGHTEIAVTLDLQVDESHYRVMRRYTRSGRSRQPSSILDLQIATGDGGYRSISEGSIGETERRLRSILHMDYETFVSTAFLLQGQADRFTVSPPARRKELLGEILGLSVYERLAERARSLARQRGEQAERVSAVIDMQQEELSKQGQYSEDLHNTQKDRLALAPSLDASAKEMQAASKELHSLEKSRAELARVRSEIEQAQRDTEGLEVQTATIRDRLSGYQETLSRRQEVEQCAIQLSETVQYLEAEEATFHRFVELEKKRIELEGLIATEKARLVEEVRSAEERIREDLAPRVARRDQAQVLIQESEAKLEETMALETQLQSGRELYQKLRASTDAMQAENERLLAEMKNLRERLDMLRTGADKHCTVCGTLLGEEGRSRLEQEMESRGQSLRQQYKHNQECGRDSTVEAKSKEKELADLGQLIDTQRREALASKTVQEHLLADAEHAEKELGTRRSDLVVLGQHIQQESYADEDRVALAGVVKALASVDYDKVRHEQLRLEARKLEPYASLMRELREAEERLPQEQTTLDGLEEMVASRKEVVVSGTVIAEELQVLLDAASMDTAHYEQVEQKYVSLKAEDRRLERETDVLQARLADLGVLAKEHDGKKQEKHVLEQERRTYTTLAQAFGKRGVQALLIEAALPELQQETNHLLARLTDNRLALLMETQRETRRGSLEETLELKVADELGTRSYELFSGGEAFRINFALRVALAKLLAGRSGAPLRTLFIDEGFGTQDAQGRDRLVDAIRSIQEEFELILVITHIEELKEAFPVRIEVNKDESGSTFRLAWV